MKLDRARIRRNFGRAAAGYSARARVQAEVAGRLLERLDGLNLDPGVILDLGAGPGEQALALKRRFPRARVVAIDLALPMLRQAAARRGRWRRRFETVAGDAEALPLTRGTVDFVYSNLMLQWCENPAGVLNHLRRVLKPGGFVLLSSFGPDTLGELREAWRAVDERPHTSRFADVQQLGDALLCAGFAEPVLDTDWLTTTYRRPADLLAELKAIGATFAGTGGHRALTGKGRIAAMLAAYEEFRRDDGLYPATWEVVYASAWAPEESAPIRSFHGEEASIPVGAIGRVKR